MAIKIKVQLRDYTKFSGLLQGSFTFHLNVTFKLHFCGSKNNYFCFMSDKGINMIQG